MDGIAQRLRNHTEGNDVATRDICEEAAELIERLSESLSNALRLLARHTLEARNG